MGREEYLRRMVLGRSPLEPPASPVVYNIQRHSEGQNSPLERHDQPSSLVSWNGYVQHYSLRGHPENRESRQLARQSRKAQNDVLSTIGVCVSVDNNGKVVNSPEDRYTSSSERHQTLLNIQENLTGFRLGMAEDMLSGLATIWCSNIRKRITTFDFYLGVPFAAIVRSEFRHFGPLKFFFAGILSSAVLQFSVFTIDSMLETARLYLTWYLFSENESEMLRKRKSLLFAGLDATLTCGLFCYTVAPIQFLMTLQQLDLVSPWTLLPGLTGISFSSLLLPKFPSTLDPNTIVRYLKSVLGSPLASLAMSTVANTIITRKLTSYVNAVVPRPDNPDPVSYKKESIDGDCVHLPAQTMPNIHNSLREELKNDYQLIWMKARALTDTLQAAFLFLIGKAAVPSDQTQDDTATIFRPRDFSSAGTVTAVDVDNLRSQSWSQEQSSTPSSTPLPTPPPQSSPVPGFSEHNQLPSLQTNSRRSSGSSTSSELQLSNVQIHARPGSTSTLHMDLEVNASLHYPNGPLYTSNFTASPHHPNIMDQRSQIAHNAALHRVTALTLHSYHSLSFNISNILNAVIRFPIVCFYHRSLARAYLSVQGNGNLQWLPSNIYPTFGARPSQFRWQETGRYMGHVMFCYGLEFLVGMVVWSTGSRAAWVIGNRWYSWGRL